MPSCHHPLLLQHTRSHDACGSLTRQCCLLLGCRLLAHISSHSASLSTDLGAIAALPTPLDHTTPGAPDPAPAAAAGCDPASELPTMTSEASSSATAAMAMPGDDDDDDARTGSTSDSASESLFEIPLPEEQGVGCAPVKGVAMAENVAATPVSSCAAGLAAAAVQAIAGTPLAPTAWLNAMSSDAPYTTVYQPGQTGGTQQTAGGQTCDAGMGLRLVTGAAEATVATGSGAAGTGAPLTLQLLSTPPYDSPTARLAAAANQLQAVAASQPILHLSPASLAAAARSFGDVLLDSAVNVRCEEGEGGEVMAASPRAPPMFLVNRYLEDQLVSEQPEEQQEDEESAEDDDPGDVNGPANVDGPSGPAIATAAAVLEEEIVVVADARSCPAAAAPVLGALVAAAGAPCTAPMPDVPSAASAATLPGSVADSAPPDVPALSTHPAHKPQQLAAGAGTHSPAASNDVTHSQSPSSHSPSPATSPTRAARFKALSIRTQDLVPSHYLGTITHLGTTVVSPEDKLLAVTPAPSPAKAVAVAGAVTAGVSGMGTVEPAAPDAAQTSSIPVTGVSAVVTQLVSDDAAAVVGQDGVECCAAVQPQAQQARAGAVGGGGGAAPQLPHPPGTAAPVRRAPSSRRSSRGSRR